MGVEDFINCVFPVCREKIRACQGVAGGGDRVKFLEQVLGLLQPTLVHVKSRLAELVANVLTVVIEVGADDLAGEVGGVGVGSCTDIPGVTN